MTEDVPPARQCTMCDREAVDPTRSGALCEAHLDALDDDDETAEPEGGFRDANPGGEPSETDENGDTDGDAPRATEPTPGAWSDADFSTTTADTYPPTLLEREQWMGRQEKLPFAPWGDADPDDADPDDSPRYEWGRTENYLDGDDVALAEDDPRLDGRVFLQQDADPFAFIDGDNVRCPETGDIHPAFRAILEHLGATYADVSTSGAGAHAYYRAPDGLPIDGKSQATFPIDTEPWGANDDPPTVEMYANKHVCVATGEHVDGTPRDVREWDADVLRSILQANGYDDRDVVEHDTDRDLGDDLEDYDADATDANETTGKVRDILKAVDRLTPRDLPLSARRTGEDSTGWGTWDPSYRTSESGESLHYNGDGVFHDHKENEAFGVLSLFAAEENIITDPWDRLAGTDWWGAVEAARDAGGDIPKYDPAETADPTGGEFPIEPCEPPAVDADPFDARERWDHLQAERYDATLDHDGPAIWADPAGAGKSTNAVLGALGRDRGVAPLFDKHEKAREVQTDDALPDDWGPFHLKGAEQKRDAVCMDADHADDRCPEHGHTSACPPMCPVYDLPGDHETRRRYEAVAAELGDVKAHLLLAEDLPGHDDDGRCPWSHQFDQLDTVGDVVGVHEYQTLKTVRDDRDVIVDESPSSLRETTRVDVEGLVRTANALEELAGVLSRTDPAAYTAERVARFVRDLADALTTDGDRDLADLETPVPVWNAYETFDDAAGNYVKREEPAEPWHLAEALAQLKVAYTETLVSRIRRDEWDGTPLCMDAVLTALAEAGLNTDPVMKAVAVPPTLDACPWCSSDLDHHNGRRCCSACSWDEQHNTLTHDDGERARAAARLDTTHTSTTALVVEQLPLQSDLPDDPLILDATATPAKAARLYDVDREDLAVYGDDHLDANMRVTQVLDGQYHASTIRDAMTDADGDDVEREEYGALAERIQTTIDTAGDLHDRPLFVVKADLKPLFEFPEHGEVLHYHATRGLNREECDAVVCIGAPHPDIDDLRREAELLAMGSDVRVGGTEHSTRRDAPNPPVYRKLNYVDEQGRGRAVPTKHYTGLVGELFRETREKELEQVVHRARPLLAEEEDPVDVYLLTNVPTALPVDEVCTFDELADPLEALLPVRDGALDLLEAIDDVRAGDGSDGFRPEALVDERDGELVKNAEEFHRLARLSGLDVTERTVRNWIADLEAVGLLQAGEYKHRAGVSYTADSATLKAALSVISNNTAFEVVAVRRFRALAEAADGTLEWLEWAREALGLRGDRCEWDPPPSTTG